MACRLREWRGMALIKMGAAARRAGAGSTSAIRRALQMAGITLTEISSGNFGVEEKDLERFLLEQPDWKASSVTPVDSGPSLAKLGKPGKPKKRKPDNRRK